MVLSLAVVLPDGTFAAPRPGPRSATGPALHELLIGAEGALGVVLGAVLRVHRLPEATVGRGYVFADLRSGLECMRSVMQSGIRPLVLRLYDPEDSAFSGFETSGGECVLVAATAGLSSVAGAEARAIQEFAAVLASWARSRGGGWQEKRSTSRPSGSRRFSSRRVSLPRHHRAGRVVVRPA
jgi:FAD/FMN-containing dehydrogenase